MPLLDDQHVQELLKLAEHHRECGECGHFAAHDYCRSCDEFYWLHAPGCRMYETKHFGHRLTIVPFVEDRGGGGVQPKQPVLECMFFANGVTAVFHDGEQQPRLQQSWLELFAEFLESHGRDPLAYRLIMPDGKKASFFRTEDGWSWRFSHEGQGHKETTPTSS
jgi:hypothetical protein